jgi:hypothetical protein
MVPGDTDEYTYGETVLLVGTQMDVSYLADA